MMLPPPEVVYLSFKRVTKLSELLITSSLILSTPLLLVSALSVQNNQLQTPSRVECQLTRLLILLCGNVFHGVEVELATSPIRLKKSKKLLKSLLKNLSSLTIPKKTMNVMNTETAIHVSVHLPLVSDADGALVEPSATEESVRLHSNVVDSRTELHTTSHAQLISELLIARDIHAISLQRNAVCLTTVNSQMPYLAKMLVPSQLLMLNATMTTRNASHVKKDLQIATPPPSVPPPVESHMPSVIQDLESAHHATQPATKTAPKSRKVATKSAKF